MSRRSWNGFHTVLCAIDFSEPSRRALRRAAAITTRTRGRLVVLFVNDPLLVAAAAAVRPRLDLGVQSAKELDRFARTTLGRTAAVRVECRVATGEPAKQILSAARRLRADLIVVGSQGLTGIALLAFGSTTTAVLKRSPVPVLVVPPNDGAARRPRSWSRGPLVAPVTLDRRTASEIDAASLVAAWFGWSLLLVHALKAPVAPAWLRRRLGDHSVRQLTPMRRRLAALAASRARVQARVQVLEGLPADAIAVVAKRERAPLVMTVLRDRRHWFDLGRGASTYRTFTQLSMPVLACPPRWRPR
jgi:nucleotide-binding universal stress UspA family protein